MPRGCINSTWHFLMSVCSMYRMYANATYVSSPKISVDKSKETRGSTFHVAIPTIPSFFRTRMPRGTILHVATGRRMDHS